MRYVRLGKTGLTVSAIGLGTWAFGGDWGTCDAEEAKEAIRRALDLGITLFDTAQAYGFSISERLLADALWERVSRAHVQVATTGGLRREGDRLVRDASPRWLRQGVESSLRNLRRDYIDLYQIYGPDPRTPAEETAAVLEDLVREGKIRHVGVSNHGVIPMEELARHGHVETLRPPYHMFRRDIEEQILPYAARHDIGVLVYGPLAHGLLGGWMSPGMAFPPDDWRSNSSDFTGERFRRNLHVVRRLKELAGRRGMSLPQLAVAWTLSHPGVHVAIVGAKRASQLDETAAVADIALSQDDRQRIDEILLAAVPVVGPSPEAM